ncbi:MAG: dihydrofolate reductase [Candidatus Omnitrophica bacterium]|nr:dihydrofolate reductase [Candidatus Omnitrophota bacterium]
MKTKFSMIAAVDANLGIGREGKLPWSIAPDMRHFKELTLAAPPGKKNVVVMGRKTWESLPEKFRPLPGRWNAVISSQRDFGLPQEVLLSPDFRSVFSSLEKLWGDTVGEIFIIGGAAVFKEGLNDAGCERLYLTRILKDFCCDVFFPAFEPGFALTQESPPGTFCGIEYYFAEYRRRLRK